MSIVGPSTTHMCDFVIPRGEDDPFGDGAACKNTQLISTSCFGAKSVGVEVEGFQINVGTRSIGDGDGDRSSGGRVRQLQVLIVCSPDCGICSRRANAGSPSAVVTGSALINSVPGILFCSGDKAGCYSGCYDRGIDCFATSASAGEGVPSSYNLCGEGRCG